MLWLLLELSGLLLFVAGAVFLADGKVLLGPLPATLTEAAIVLVGGSLLMLIATANLMRRLRQLARVGVE